MTQWLTAAAALVSAIAAMASAIVGPTVATRITNRPFRQKAIESLRDCLAEVISTAASLYRASYKNTLTSAEEQDKTIQLTLLISRAELMLDPSTESHRTLIQNLDRVRHTAFGGNRQLDQFPDAVEQLKRQSRIVFQELKA